jgi:predicted TPR repeat methyltransferase
LFDEYAKDFERHVQDKLKYSVPQELRRLWDSLAGKSEEKPLALDLGCGTGLVGKAFDGAVRSVVGIDLSPQMLASAAQKNVYDALYEDDIFAYLERTDTKYDLVIAADVLIYLGDFSRVLELLGQQLKANGYFLFSVEATEKEEYALQPSGRYAHNIEYIEAALSDHGLSVLTKEDVVVRYDNDEPLAGHLFVCQKVD